MVGEVSLRRSNGASVRAEKNATVLRWRYEIGKALRWRYRFEMRRSEAWHRGLMRCHAQVGNTAVALSQFHACRTILRQARAADPSSETHALYLISSPNRQTRGASRGR